MIDEYMMWAFLLSILFAVAGIAFGAILVRLSVPVIRCKDCKWFGDIGCAISIVDDTDKPSEDDYCSFAERKEE